METHRETIRIDAAANVYQANDNTLPSLQKLNEYCLLEIFSSNSLSPLDLCSLAETCKLFKRIIQSVFPKEFDIMQKKHGYEIQSKTDQITDASAQDVERILKHFGPRLSTLWTKRNKVLLNMAAIHCSDGALKQLNVEKMKSGLEPKFTSIFQRLQKLRIHDCDFINSATTPNINFDSLIELEIFRTTGCVEILRHNFPNLEIFEFTNSEIDAEDGDECSSVDIFFDFFRRHKGLKDLHMILDGKDASGIIQTIGNCCNLETLCLEAAGTSKDFSHLQRLTQLKTLHINGAFNSLYIALLPELKTLETVTIMGQEASAEMFDTLSKLKNLRNLDLVAIICDLSAHIEKWGTLGQIRKLKLSPFQFRASDYSLSDIIRQLPNLEELTFNDAFRAFQLSEEDFYKIVKMVAGRPQVLTLNCKFDFVDNCEENEKVRLINEN